LTIANEIPNSITVGADTYSLGHLKSATTVLVGQGKEGGDIVVKVSATSHTYSCSPVQNDVADFQDENGKSRVFSKDRYKASKHLVAHCINSIQTNSLTWESKDRNNKSCFMMIEMDSGQHYAIFFRLVPTNSGMHDVTFIIKSAYIVAKPYLNPRRYNIRSLIKKCHYDAKSLP
jgi:hypothetical protein